MLFHQITEYRKHYHKEDSNFRKLTELIDDEGRIAESLLDYDNINKKVLKQFLDIAMPACAFNDFASEMAEGEKGFDELVTVAEEAFAILVFENDFARWSHVAERKEETAPAPIYQKKVDPGKNTDKHAAGDWTEKGLNRYNDIVNMIIEMREKASRLIVMNQVKKLYEKELEGRSKKKSRKRGRNDEDDNAQKKKAICVINLFKG